MNTALTDILVFIDIGDRDDDIELTVFLDVPIYTTLLVRASTFILDLLKKKRKKQGQEEH
ncbi:hypothetical protein SK128_027542, partial [Halocaridina rubra]